MTDLATAKHLLDRKKTPYNNMIVVHLLTNYYL